MFESVCNSRSWGDERQFNFEGMEMKPMEIRQSHRWPQELSLRALQPPVGLPLADRAPVVRSRQAKVGQ